MANQCIPTLLELLRNKGGAWQSQNRARSILHELKLYLPEDEYQLISIAHNHYVLGEGAEELYDICKKLYNKYKILI